MSGEVQHRSKAFSGNTGSLAFSSSVTAGNLIVVALAAIQGEPGQRVWNFVQDSLGVRGRAA